MQQTLPAISLDATGEVFMKTLGLFCALKEYGCSFIKTTKNGKDDEETATKFEYLHPDPSHMPDLVEVLRDIRSPRTVSNCSGRLLFERNKYGHCFVR